MGGEDDLHASNREPMEAEMSMNFPVLPIGAGTLSRAIASLLAVTTRWAQTVAKARRNRQDARKLAGFDRRMLADIGITRADVRDAFSEPFWEDPTALLRERAIERRMNRGLSRAQRGVYAEYSVRGEAPSIQPSHAA
jgi:uncharacterized protein YjiS (DUF1127 family)